MKSEGEVGCEVPIPVAGVHQGSSRETVKLAAKRKASLVRSFPEHGTHSSSLSSPLVSSHFWKLRLEAFFLAFQKLCDLPIQNVKVCLTLCHPMDCSLSGSSVHRILQARIMEWVVISSSRASSRSRDQTQVSCTAGGFFAVWATREAQTLTVPEHCFLTMVYMQRPFLKCYLI